jgi:hypothetical protein
LLDLLAPSLPPCQKASWFVAIKRMRFLLGLLVAAAGTAPATAAATVAFANALGSHMVLQQAPSRAQLWGSGPAGETVTLKLVLAATPSSSETTVAELSVQISANGRWLAKLPPVAAKKGATVATHTVTATASGGSSAVLEDIVYGDVFVCTSPMPYFTAVLALFCANLCAKRGALLGRWRAEQHAVLRRERLQRHRGASKTAVFSPVLAQF